MEKTSELLKELDDSIEGASQLMKGKKEFQEAISEAFKKGEREFKGANLKKVAKLEGELERLNEMELIKQIDKTISAIDKVPKRKSKGKKVKQALAAGRSGEEAKALVSIKNEAEKAIAKPGKASASEIVILEKALEALRKPRIITPPVTGSIEPVRAKVKPKSQPRKKVVPRKKLVSDIEKLKSQLAECRRLKK